MTTVAVTGCSGYIGRRLCEAFEADPSVGRVVGIDVREPSFSTRNLEFYPVDVRSPDLAAVIDGCESIVHLAAVNGSDDAEMQDVIAGGMRSVTTAAMQAQVRKLVFTSAAAVYGPRLDAVPLGEDAPVRPSPGSYGAANAQAEEATRTFAFERRDAVVTILRLADVWGPTMSVPPAGGSFHGPYQALHEDDAVRAIQYVLTTGVPGTFNVCSDDLVTGPRGARTDVIRSFARRAGRLTDAPAVMSNERLRAAGFEFMHTSADALRAGADAQRGWMSVAGVRVRPRWVALAAGSIAALALSSVARAASARRAKG